MPCHSWGIPATDCRTGSKLAEIEGTICNGCYALKGSYAWPRVERAYRRRLDRSDTPRWIEAMAKLVEWQANRNRTDHFRWFDSGDIQSLSMLERIAAVASETPNVSHWLPTREYGIVRSYLAANRKPENLTIRISSVFVDREPQRIANLPTSTVHRDEPPRGYVCPAYERKPAQCGDCRACWEPYVENVSYPHH